MFNISNLALAANNSSDPGLLPVLLEITVVCAIAGLVGQLLKLPFIPILLLAGILVGPDALAVVHSLDRFTEISHIAVIILLFGVGLEIDLSSSAKSFLKECLTGTIATLLCLITITGALLLFKMQWQEALTLGMALSLSSTAVVLRILVRARQLKTKFGSLTLSILVTQDILVLGMLACLPIMASTLSVVADSESSVQAFSSISDYLLILAKVLGVILFVVTLRFCMPRLMSIALKERTSDIVLFVGIAIALGIAKVITTIGFSYEIGAFVAGLVLAGTQFRYQLGSQLAPFREFFLGIFFLTVGMQLSPLIIWEHLGSILALVAILLLSKIVGIFLACMLMGVTSKTALLTAFSLSQAGEFGLILMQEAGRYNLVGSTTASVVLAAIIITLILTPFLLFLGRKATKLRFISNLQKNVIIEQVADKLTTPVVILVGYGPSGRRIGKFLVSQAIPFHVIDLSSTAIQQLKQQGLSATLGDATQSEVLEHAGITDADILALAIPDEQAALKIAAVAKGIKPNIHVAIRLVHEARLADAELLNLEAPVVEELVVGDTLVNVIEGIMNPGKLEDAV